METTENGDSRRDRCSIGETSPMEAGAELIARARLICGEQHVLTHPAVLSTYRSDGHWRDGPLPLAAVLPRTAAEVSGVLAACAATGTPYVARGAGTSVSGGAVPVGDGILIVLSRMRRILRVAAGAKTITVEPGVPPAALARAGERRWFSEPVVAGTVGGHIADTCGITNVSHLELARPDGTLVRLTDRNPGYDLTGAFPGSRGRAGIAVAITLRALPNR